MRYGYWLPVFGGWLRNVEDEGMEASWNYVSRLARRSEQALDPEFRDGPPPAASTR